MLNIVMVAHSRHRLLEQSLKSLFAGTDRDNFTLTCVDDGSTDFRIRKLLESYCQYANTTWIRLEKSAHVIARAKNIGVAWSEQTFGRGNWLYLSDSDVYFIPGWYKAMVRCATMTEEDEQFRLWGGQLHPFHQASDDCVIECGNGMRVHHVDVLDGPSWLMSWATWDTFGPLRSNCAPGPGQSEEYPFCCAVNESGHKIGVVSPHVVAHCGLTNSLGKPVPGAELLGANRLRGVLYE